MNDRKAHQDDICSSGRISQYIDGELTVDEVRRFEEHIASCSACRNELNDQKSFLLALSDSLKEDEPEIPNDFVRSVVARAESGVSGLRLRAERLPTMAIVCGLLLTAAIILGAETLQIFGGLASAGQKLILIMGLIAHSVYNLIFGATQAIRTTFVSNAPLAVVCYLALALAAVITVRYLSRPIVRFFRDLV